jgi:adenylate cyclase class 2
MAKVPRHQEIEIKLPVAHLFAVRRLLKRLGARQVVPRVHESNVLYDTRTKALRRRGQLIRIRTEQSASGSGKEKRRGGVNAILTYKAPTGSPRGPRQLGGKRNSKSRFKIKAESEVSVTGAGEMERILRGLGLHPQFRYEKYRTTYLLPGVRGLKVELDETPVGVYLELEGSRAGIDQAASRLGYSRSEYITETYGALYLADCRRRGQKPCDMLFPTAKKSR